MVHINLSSFAGGGKTTVANLLMATFKTVVIPQVTTRSPRPVGEGPEYIFKSVEEFLELEKQGKFLCSKPLAEVPGYHGVLRPEYWPKIPDKIELVLSMFGSQAPIIKEEIPHMKLVFISFENMRILRDRLWHRCQLDGSNFDAKWALNQRYLATCIESQYDFITYNDGTPEECLTQIISIIADIVLSE